MRLITKTHRTHRRAYVLALITLLLAAVPMLAAADTAYLEFTSDGLEPLGPGFVYEGWLIVDGAAVSAGRFSIMADGSLSRSGFAIEVADLAAVDTYVLTVEPMVDADLGPSHVHVLGGDFSGGTAMLTAGHPAALGDDFSSVSGPYILNAPSGGGAADYFNGIWWLNPSAGPGPTLDLPALPAGWTYEGWVASADGPVSTGRFLMASGDDSDIGGISAGPHGTPPFPGQDFINPAFDLTDGFAAVISIEPDPDNSPNPFTFKPLVDGMIDDVGAGVLQDMDNNSAGFPTAVVSLRENSSMGETAHLQLVFHGLEDLGSDWAYEGWLIVDGAPVSTGTFTIDGGGMQSQTAFPTEVSSLDAISTFVLTIEPVPDSDPSPSHVHILGGDVIGGRASLTIDHMAALGTDFGMAAGSYILAAPSGGGSAPYVNGIWWLDPNAGPGPSLELPELPAGWVYEGWVVGGSGPISTGRFTSASGEDSDGTGPDAGPEAGPSFPGQDFVDPAIDLTGYVAVISVEPEPDNSMGPFTLKPLMDRFIDDIGEGVLQPMSRNPSALPNGHAILLHQVVIPGGGNVVGFGGARWLTDLDVANMGGMATSVTIQLLAADQANPTPESVSLSLEPGASVRYRDAFAELFDFEGTGALRVLVDNPYVTTSSRTYASDEDGSYGQGVPAHTAMQAISYGRMGRLVGLSESGNTNDGFRTNIGLANATGTMTTVVVALYSSDNGLVDTIEVTLAAYEQRQLNRVFPEATEVGSAVLTTSTPGGAFFAYGSVVDNKTADPTFIAIQ
jgi:hypothetical protein